MLALNREYTKQEYDACHQVVIECLPHLTISYDPNNPDSFRKLMLGMLPLLMMRHRRIPRAKWTDKVSSAGKHWIEQTPDDMSPEKFIHSMIGYHLTVDNSLCGMAMTQGTKRRVVNIGLGIKQYAVHPKGASVDAYVQSLQHKLTTLELSHISGQEDATKLRRLCITLAMKDAYIKAIGQPVGFDYSRLEFDVGNKRAFGDGHILGGWEFRVFTANLGVARGTKLVQEQYECVCAFFRGSPESTFIWHDTPKQLESWVQFINIDQMVKVLPKLSA
ncbi:uncharacterized protein LACBIDRAFT_293947 [Laccaria bicolor S238N-H82]|uniref:Predicted protein n=1 Tax=Laccaria bicolor (strain S238N-H82 / ATCC MYA-4686) TaxID=486041 RepID=B0D7V1_LACBS|nr:uncharacterized protein LACBIDRAFT_293947 [Laccaria bicolor S238N-H82]EDR09468.1 predicted protein [Laccaria bicolor S238N-H82]|eukprot:XP_001879817.1 predicted protein [Laccaria bicolor S238N-H82]